MKARDLAVMMAAIGMLPSDTPQVIDDLKKKPKKKVDRSKAKAARKARKRNRR